MYRHMIQRPQPARFVLDSPPSSVFEGLWYAAVRRDGLIGAVAIAGMLSKFCGVLLVNVPFSSAQTYTAHRICAWASVAMLGYMIATLLLYITIVRRAPHLPLWPTTIAARLYYVCDSRMFADFERTSLVGRRDRDRHVQGIGRRYRFGRMMGISGDRKVGVDYAETEPGIKLRTFVPFSFGRSRPG